MKSGNNAVLIAYVASPHAGYLKFFRQYAGGILFVLGDEFIKDFKPLVRHLPGVTPGEAMRMIEALGIFSAIQILTPRVLRFVRLYNVVMPDEDVSHAFAEKYLVRQAVTFDGSWRLRWDWGATQQNRRPEGERVISVNDLDRELMHQAFREADRSPDWWRQIGALLVKDGKVLLAACNQHVPHEQSNYLYGDPRSNFEPGQSIEVSGAAHAEMVLLGTASEQGICTRGCSLYVSTFPCPPCAYPWSFAGLRRLYYADGYALVAGAEALQAKGVEIIHVQM